MNIEAMSTNQRISFLLKDTSIYGISIALSKSTSLILLPIISYNLSPEDYGIIDFFQVIIQTLAILVVFGIESAVARYFYELNSQRDRVELISQSFFLQFLFILIYICLVGVSYKFIHTFLLDITKSKILLPIILFQVPFMAVLNFCTSILKWTFSRKKFLILSIGLTLFNFILIVVLSTLSNLTIENFFAVSLFSYCFYSLMGIFFIKDWLVIPREYQWVKKLISYSFPLLILSLLNMSLPLIERTFIYSYIGTQEMGLFAISAKMGVIIMTFITAFQTSWGPFSLSLHKNASSIHTYNLVLKSFTICIFLIINICIWLTPHLIDFFFAEGYTTNRNLLSIIFFGLGINGIGSILLLGISISNKTSYSLYSYVISILIGIIFMKLTLENYGIYGVAVGTLIGIICRSLLNYYFSQKLHPIDWDFFPIIKFILLILSVNVLILNISITQVFLVDIFFIFIIFLTAFSGWKFLLNKDEKINIIEWLSNNAKK